MEPLKMTRRRSTLAATAGALLPNVALAADVTTAEIGDTTVSMLSDGHFDVPRSFFSDTEQALAGTVGDTVKLGATVWLVRNGKRLLLVDAGAGQAMNEMFPTVGHLDMLLAAEGVAETDVTDIVVTHMHPDHIGGLMGPGAGGYTNATIHVSEAEWAFWTDGNLRDATTESDRPIIDLVQAIAASLESRIKTHSGDADLGAGLSLMPLPGHTPGHCGLRITNKSQELLLVGDAIISEAMQFADPTIQYALDVDPEQAVATRISLLKHLADTHATFSATHLPYPGIGRVTRSGSAFHFEPES